MIEINYVFTAVWFLPMVGFIISSIITTIILLTLPLHARFTADTSDGPQKIHHHLTPRIGGVTIFMCMVIIGLLGMFDTHPILLVMMGSAVPVFLGGLLEDLTSNISPRIRLLLAIVSGACFVYFSGYTITRVSFAPMDAMLASPIIAIGFSIFSVVLFTNAVNIIDGLNGLSIGTSVLIAAAIAGLAGFVGDTQLMTISLAFIYILIGLGLFNWPKGKIFVGDGGAYFMGAFIAFMVIMLTERNESVSPFVSLLLVIYPSYETVRSAIRRLFSKNGKALHPDQRHLHSLVHQCFVKKNKILFLNQNSFAGLTMLAFPLFTSLWAFFSVSSTENALIGLAVFVVAYEMAVRRLGG